MTNHVHDIAEILMMSLALGMDAFSLAIGVGLNGLNRAKSIQLSILIGVFHVFMTFGGLIAGLMLQSAMGKVAQWFGAVLLMGLGLHMAYNTLFAKKGDKGDDGGEGTGQRVGVGAGGKGGIQVGSTLSGMMLFSAGVSIDSLSVGFSLGLRSTAFGIISAFVFGLVATIMCLLGLFIGKRATKYAGTYGELIGATILIGYGIHFLFT